MKVVHIITSLTTGGAERQLELLVGRSADQNAVIALYEGGPVADSLRAAGHPVQILGMHGWRKALTWFRLALLLRRYRADVVHVHLLAAQLWGIPAARLAGVPVVVSTEHSLMDDTVEGRPHSPWLRRLYRLLERLSSHTIAVSSTTADRLASWSIPAARITVVDNGIDFAALTYDEIARQQVRAELGIDLRTVVIGAVGRLDPVKRLDQVLRASAPVLRGRGHVLVIAGTGDLRLSLQKLAAELGVTDSVRWLGARGDVPRVLSAIDVLVSASRDETFGMAVIEALGNGLPVVYAQCPALEELSAPPAWAVRVPDSTGPEAELTELNRALELVLAGSLARHEVPTALTARYGVNDAAAKVGAVYRRLSAGRAR
jgi:glycosyltransferase involved in cell wall biosynthesis